MSSVAVTDHGNMFGTIDFYKKAKDAGIKPIIGIEAYVAGPKGREDRTEKVANHLILLAKNEEGYANLRYLSSHGLPATASTTTRASTRSCSRSTARASFALTACLGGEVTARLLPRRHGPRPRARRSSTRTSSSPATSSSRSSPTGCPSRRRPTTNLKQLSRDLDIPLVATADAHYIKREDAARARAADVHRLGQDARRQQADAALHRQALRHQPRGDAARTSRTSPRRSTTRMRIAEHVQRSSSSSASPCCPPSRCPTATRPTLHGGAGHARASHERFKELPLPRSTARRYLRAPGAGARVIQKMGFARLLPHRPGLHQLGEEARHPGGPGPRLRRRLARRLRAAHHRPRSRSRTTCSSSASSTPSACRCPTSTSTSARTAATRSSSTSPASTARTTSGRSSPSAR